MESAQAYDPSKTLEFTNLNQLKKKSVRGLLRKRAKKYECTSLPTFFNPIIADSEASSD